jgi:hypothetical protein
MGTAKKNKELISSTIPGPGQYLIPGFADLVLKKAAKRPKAKMDPNQNFDNTELGSTDMKNMMDILEDEEEGMGEYYNNNEDNSNHIAEHDDEHENDS